MRAKRSLRPQGTGRFGNPSGLARDVLAAQFRRILSRQAGMRCRAMAARTTAGGRSSGSVQGLVKLIRGHGEPDSSRKHISLLRWPIEHGIRAGDGGGDGPSPDPAPGVLPDAEPFAHAAAVARRERTERVCRPAKDRRINNCRGMAGPFFKGSPASTRLSPAVTCSPVHPFSPAETSLLRDRSRTSPPQGSATHEPGANEALSPG